MKNNLHVTISLIVLATISLVLGLYVWHLNYMVASQQELIKTQNDLLRAHDIALTMLLK